MENYHRQKVTERNNVLLTSTFITCALFLGSNKFHFLGWKYAYGVDQTHSCHPECLKAVRSQMHQYIANLAIPKEKPYTRVLQSLQHTLHAFSTSGTHLFPCVLNNKVFIHTHLHTNNTGNPSKGSLDSAKHKTAKMQRQWQFTIKI